MLTHSPVPTQSNSRTIASRSIRPGTISFDARGRAYMVRNDGVRKLDDNSLYILQAGAEKLSKARKTIRTLVYGLVGVLIVSGLVLVWTR